MENFTWAAIKALDSKLTERAPSLKEKLRLALTGENSTQGGDR
jgi:hypothetical protein